MKEFEKDYRKWSKVALISVVAFLFAIAAIDSFLGFDFSRNMYLMAIVVAGCMMTLISLSWITILNTKLMRTGLVEPIKPAVGGQSDGGAITLADIEMCIRKEGYVPQADEDRVCVKIAGELYEVFYENEKFILVKRFNIGEDTDMSILTSACSQAQDEIFLFRGYVHTFDTGQSVLCFEVETYVRSLSELERYFPQYLSVLISAVNRHREIYCQLDEARQQKIKESTAPAIVEPKVVS